MSRPAEIGEWIETCGDRTVIVHATLYDNRVKLYRCEETTRGLWRDSVEMPVGVLHDFAARADGIVADPRQMELLG
jgi:hypothetical protein